jgi:hypothetical protein
MIYIEYITADGLSCVTKETVEYPPPPQMERAYMPSIRLGWPGEPYPSSVEYYRRRYEFYDIKTFPCGNKKVTYKEIVT